PYFRHRRRRYGNMGAESRFNYSAVGDAVNIAARIETTCKTVSFDILASDDTVRSLQGWALLDAGSLELKGKSTRTRINAVVGDENVGSSPDFAELRLLHGKLVEALQSRLPGTRKMIAAAKVKAAGLPTGLQEFYGRISRRADDFVGKRAGAAMEANAGYAEQQFGSGS
ncbi:MAG: adenylate/guanylate cyclase domain-containing protein, partial [Mesorhizobium sp.]